MIFRGRLALAFLLPAAGVGPVLAAPAEFAALSEEYDRAIVPLLAQHCLDCHDEASRKGELDLERFSDLSAVRADPKTWQGVLHQLEIGEMPPRKKNRVPPTAAEHARLISWTQRYLHHEARSRAGDPGPVILRRLSNAEYTYTIRDLTGVPSLDPLREFPVDSAAGEGFTNAGGALVMSPSLLEKYLAAGKELAAHAVLLPDGFRFSAHTTRRDQSHEILEAIRAFYLRHTGGEGIDFAYRSEVRRADPGERGEGRLDLTPYFAALLAHRDERLADPGSAAAVADEAGINARYLHTLASVLGAEPDGSFLLDHLRARFRAARPDEAAALASEVRAWQDRLWTFQKIGTFGLVRPWQVPVSPVATAKDVRLPIDAKVESIFLSAPGFGNPGAVVEWQQPRFERPGRPPILLRDAERGLAALRVVRDATLRATASYLAAARQLRTAGAGADHHAIASAHQVDPDILAAWAAYLGLAHEGRARIEDPLTAPVRNDTYPFVKGWTLPGVADFSLLANTSDQDVRIPGDLRGHRVVVHPRPERWIAAGWMSPIDGRVDLLPAVRDAHNACGNGVTWALERRRGSHRQILSSGTVDLGGRAAIDPLRAIDVRAGDLFSIVIGARDGSHVCDLTEIDLVIRELEGSGRSWSLAGDCADSIDAGNPHPDRHGHAAVWYFHGGLNEDTPAAPGVPPGSLLDQWLHAGDREQAGRLAEKLASFLTHDPPSGTSPEDVTLHRQLTSLGGVLFSHLDLGALAAREGHPPAQSFDAEGNLRTPASATLQFALPAALVAGSEFVARGVVHSSSEPGAAVQMQVTTTPPSAAPSLQATEPVVVASEGTAGADWDRAFAQFREFFPAAMCYARVVPADEVVTLQLYHREDEPLARLLLDEGEKEHLDRLWRELRFVSREPLRLVTAYEQIWQFATQDSDPTKLEPLEPPIRAGAATFRETLAEAEASHLAALLAFAPKVYRRPLREAEEATIRGLYQQLRAEDLSHEDAFRLTLARLFTSAAYLYKAETPAPGPEQGPVDAFELATRLSYFLTSSTPDADLARSARDGSLLDPDVLVAHTRRLLRDPRTRRLAIHFGCQWLHVRDFDRHDEKNEQLYPEFADLRSSMYEETVRFFADFFRNNRSILSLLDADHTFVDPALARFYELPAPEAGWQRVDGIQQSGRGGILGFATTLAKHSGASRTSLILRGTWISETLLGEKLPRPPKNVPPLPDVIPEGLSEREFVVRHSSDPACAKCHDRIDPYGFALEGFDTIGRFRANADTRAKLPDGSSVEGLDGLRTWLLTERRDTFVRHFCRKLLGYALGREVRLSDEPLLDEIVAELEGSGFRVGLAVEAIVRSRQFREIRPRQHP